MQVKSWKFVFSRTRNVMRGKSPLFEIASVLVHLDHPLEAVLTRGGTSSLRLFSNEHFTCCKVVAKSFSKRKVLWKNFPRERPDTLTSPAAGS